jgi:hypothetical protein
LPLWLDVGTIPGSQAARPLREFDLPVAVLGHAEAGARFDPAAGGRMTTPDYDTDFYAWTQAQAEAIRAGTWDAVDRAHLAEEVEDVGKSERRALVSHLRVLLTHLLKWQVQPERRSDGWVDSMLHAQIEAQTIIEDSPSLSPELPTFVARAYTQACRVAARETRLDLGRFPDTCAWTPEDLLDPETVPEK